MHRSLAINWPRIPTKLSSTRSNSPSFSKPVLRHYQQQVEMHGRLRFGRTKLKAMKRRMLLLWMVPSKIKKFGSFYNAWWGS
ncbi:hypothetical protein GOP47_0014680 [Adiantum capillus-veneris]|uniref:Uncharacterized protein n=1 Tax=Adiantum capillus-veneris TaxID=13818 RepID=A0A9D4UM90_ADICA|nr:hypothetical protein GOP47_0014680 [Adiantum capillus-veneris]